MLQIYLVLIKKNVTFNRKRIKITQRCKKNVAFVEKESYKSSLKVKIIEKLEIISIFLVNTEAHQIVFVN